jgi:uncharacterized protein (TIGR02996 family)
MSPETFRSIPRTPLEDAILEDPLDDGVRLVLADYLEEQGDVLCACFIRSQVRLAQEVGWQEAVGPPPDGKFPSLHWTPHQVQLFVEARRSYHTLDLHVKPLLIRHARWITDCFQYRHSWQHWRRGFLHHLSLRLHELFLFGKAFFLLQPFLEVSLTDRVPGDPLRPVGTYSSRKFWALYPVPDVSPSEVVHPFYLPSELFNILCSLRALPSSRSTSGATLLFDSLEEAERYLSVACVLWGRRQAGLPCPDSLVSFLLQGKKP